jgi:hypothetical protein
VIGIWMREKSLNENLILSYKLNAVKDQHSNLISKQAGYEKSISSTY